MKKFILMLSVLFAGNVMAQKLTVENISVDKTEGGELYIGIEAENPVQAVQFTLVLPEGLSIMMEGESYYADPLPSKSGGIMPRSNNTVKVTPKDEGLQIVAFNTDGPFLAAAGNFALITLEADASLAEGTVLDCKMVDIKAGSLDADKKVVPAGEFSDVSFQIGIGVVPTGINSLNAADSNAPVYNLAGQQVGKNYKGIVVKNGKKAIVK